MTTTPRTTFARDNAEAPCGSRFCGRDCRFCNDVPLMGSTPTGPDLPSPLPTSPARPSGLPLLSTAVLTPDERTLLRQIGITCGSAAALIDEATSVDDGCGRVDRSLHALDFIAQMGDRARALMATLGSGRQ